MEPAQESEVTREARLFAAKTARSIAEIQQSVNNLADVMVFLEVLGYDERIVKKHGFANMQELAKYVYNFVDVYDETQEAVSFAMAVPRRSRRLAEGLSMIFPWLGSLVILFITGVSLWMAWGLPAEVTAMFLSGVFLGLMITEGILQNFTRLFTFYYSQTNIGEVKRSVQRSYTFLGIILSAAVTGIYGLSALAGIPFELSTVAAMSTVTISLHRVSYVVLYALKKLAHLAVSYTGAFAVLLGVFFVMPGFIPDLTVRYFAALGTAFAVLSGFAVYHHYKITGQSSTSIVAKGAPHFYSPLTVNDSTITSRFGVQLWECSPYFAYGTFYFILIFADRILSWFFNPVSTLTSGGIVLPISFNSVYHIGADLALLIILPAAIVQYVMASPMYILVHNRAVDLKVSENYKINLFLRQSYRRILGASIAVSLAGAVVLNLAAPFIIDNLGGTEVSLRILIFASAGAVLLSLFAANAIYMILLGRIKPLAVITFIAALVVVAGGLALAQYGFENIIFAYLAATFLAAAASAAVMSGTIKNGSSRLFARFV